MKINYEKTPLKIVEQISLLESRGLIINDKNYAEKILGQISYYRLSAYSLVFEVDETGEERLKERKHLFKCDTTFERVVNLYNYDAKLRGYLLKTILEIEVLIKTLIAYELSINLNDPFVLYDKKIIYIENNKNESKHNEIIENLNNACNAKQEIFINHYENRYSNAPKMPIWLAVEVMTIGNVARYYSLLKKDYQKLISRKLNIGNPVILSQWLHTINYLRNRAAHNHRIFNRVSAYAPKIDLLKTELQILREDDESNRVYYSSVLNSIQNTKLNKCIYTSVIMLEYIISHAKIDAIHIKNIYTIINDLITSYPEFKESMGIDKNMASIKALFL